MIQVPKKAEFPPPGPFKLSPEDKHHLMGLSDAVDNTVGILKKYKKGDSSEKEVVFAFNEIYKYLNVENAISKMCANFIVSELKNLRLKVKCNGNYYCVHDFLKDYASDKISSKKVINMGFKGIAQDALSVILDKCRADLIIEQYGY